MSLTKEQRTLLQRILNSPTVSPEDLTLHEIALKLLNGHDLLNEIWLKARNALYDLTENNLDGVQQYLREIMEVASGD